MLKAHVQAQSFNLRRLGIDPGAGKHRTLAGKVDIFSGSRPRVILGPVRAVISSGDSKSKSGVETTDKLLKNSGSLASSSSSEGINVRAVIKIRKKMKEKLTDKIEDQWQSLMNGIGRGISIQLVSEDTDPGQFWSTS